MYVWSTEYQETEPVGVDKLDAHPGYVLACVWSPNGEIIATCGRYVRACAIVHVLMIPFCYVRVCVMSFLMILCRILP